MSIITDDKYDYLYQRLFDDLNAGLLVVDRDGNVLAWNRFMEVNSSVSSSDIIGKSIYDYFPYLSAKWLQRRIRNVFVLKSFSYTSWRERPYLFEFKNNRPITSSVEHMFQDVSFIPIRRDGGDIEAVGIAVFEMTDIGIYQNKLREANDMIVSLEEKSRVDGLTGVFNRMTLDMALDTEFERAKLYTKDLSVILFDLDHFKTVNDTYGHLAGDEVLRVVSQKVKGRLHGDDIIGRYGGEEFTVILPNTNLAKAAIIAERLRLAVCADPVAHEDMVIPVTASFGAASLDKTIVSLKQLLQNMDDALYESKKNGRNRVTCCNKEK